MIVDEKQPNPRGELVWCRNAGAGCRRATFTVDGLCMECREKAKPRRTQPATTTTPEDR